MQKHKPVSLDIKDVLRQMGLDINQFMLWSESESKKGSLPNQVNVRL